MLPRGISSYPSSSRYCGKATARHFRDDLVAGLARYGTYIKYIPYPVVTGFTAGIAVIIFTSQIEPLLGLSIAKVPAAFLAKWQAYFLHIGSIHAEAALLAARIPLACLGAVRVVVAWNMSEVERFRHLMQAPPPDRLVLLTTFLLTVLVDLTVAIEVGVVLAALLFMKRMAEAVEIQTQVKIIQEDMDDFARGPRDRYDPAEQSTGNVAVFEINGPFFFGAAARLNDVLEHVQGKPKVFILRMRNVPLIDATGVTALRSFIDACTRRGTAVVLAGVQPRALEVIARMGLTQGPQGVRLAADTAEAMRFAKGLATGAV